MPYVFAHGSGTEIDPYQVWNIADLNGVRDHPSSHFIQMDDIDLAEVEDWVCIGVGVEMFEGTFEGTYNGNNFEISNLGALFPLFFVLDEASVVKNMILRNFSIDGSHGMFMGASSPLALVGSGTVQSCKVIDCLITGFYVCGGLIGQNEGLIKNCQVSGWVNGIATEEETYGLIGGIAGASSRVIEDCTFSGKVSGNTLGDIGGVVGALSVYGSEPPVLRRNTVMAQVSGSFRVGGLVGGVGFQFSLYPDPADEAIISDCCVLRGPLGYTVSATSSGDEYPGGLVGYLEDDNFSLIVTNCYTNVDNRQHSFLGRDKHMTLVGKVLGAISIVNSYYQNFSTLPAWNAYGEPRSQADMAFPYNSETTYIGWDFEDIWGIDSDTNNGYPYLLGEVPDPPIEQLDQVAKPVWYDYGATWVDVDNAVNYEVRLYKDSMLNTTKTVPPGMQFCSFGPELVAAGVGSYTVTVKAKGDLEVYADGEESEESDALDIVKLDTVGQPVWSDSSITWAGVNNASSYQVILYNGLSVVSTKLVRSSLQAVDFTVEMLNEGPGSYTATVQALGNGITYLDGDVSIASAVKRVEGPYRLYNATDTKKAYWNIDGVWTFFATPDHGTMDGLGDDDHSQYLNETRHDTSGRHTLGTVVPHDSHGNLSGIGSNTHEQIDTHIGSTENPHSVTKGQVGLSEVANVTQAAKYISINEQPDSYTLTIEDDGKLIDMAKDTGQTLTVPKNSSVGFPVGTQILVRQKGAGQVTIAPVDGDVVLNSAGTLDTAAQYSVINLLKVAEDVWAVFGDIS